MVESKAVYEAKPVLRNLQQEAVTAFMPTAVKMKMDKGKGQAGLMEPEEAEMLERQGYLQSGDKDGHSALGMGPSRNVTMEEVEDEG